MASPQKVATLTIPNGGTDSNEITRDDFGRCKSLSVQCLAAALTATCVVQTNSEQDGSGTWTTVQSPPGTDTAIAALKSIILLGVPFGRLRIHSSGAEAGNRAFQLWG